MKNNIIDYDTIAKISVVRAYAFPLCGQKCDNNTLEITNLKSTKLTTTTACIGKVKLTSFTTITTAGPTTITGNVYVRTDNNSVTVNLSSSPAVGCVIYVIYDSGNNTCTVNGALTDNITVPPCSFRCFIKTPVG